MRGALSMPLALIIEVKPHVADIAEQLPAQLQQPSDNKLEAALTRHPEALADIFVGVACQKIQRGMFVPRLGIIAIGV